jgi:hypothetical protein
VRKQDQAQEETVALVLLAVIFICLVGVEMWMMYMVIFGVGKSNKINGKNLRKMKPQLHGLMYLFIY